MRRPWLLPLMLLLPLALASLVGADEERKDEEAPGLGRPTGRLPSIGVSHWDVERIEDRDAGKLDKLGTLGRMWVKTVAIPWGRVERKPYRGGIRAYDWSDVDRAMLLWQLAGFEPVPVLSPRCAWAGIPIDKTDWAKRLAATLAPGEVEIALRSGIGAAPPATGRWGGWERFVEAFIERYDGDGKQDMPGLRRPLRYVQILDRVDLPAYWLGSGEDYLRLLHHAGLGRERANPTVRIIHGAVDLQVVGYAPLPPDDAAWKFRFADRVPKTPPAARMEALRAHEIVSRTIEMPRLFDAIAHVGTHNLADDSVNIRFLRALLDRNEGGSVKEIWLIDNPVTKLSPSRVPRAKEATREERAIRRRWLPVARLRKHSEHWKAMTWVRRGQAYDLIRSYARARAAGASSVLFYPRADQVPDAPFKPNAENPGIPPGLLSSVDDGSFVTHTPGPMWYAWRQLWRHTQGHSKVVEADIAAQGRSIVFDVPARRKLPFVAILLLDTHLSWAGAPGEEAPKQRVVVPLPNGRYVLESCDTGENQPGRKEVVVTDGVLVVELGPAPVYVIPRD